jgi:hypothetical protein
MTYMSAVNCCELLWTAQLQQSQGTTFVKLPSLGHGRSATITLSHDVPTLAEHVKTIRLYQQNLLHIRLTLLTGPSKPQGKPHSTIYVCRIATHASSCDKKLEVSRVDRVSSAAGMGRPAPEKVCTTLTWMGNLWHDLWSKPVLKKCTERN